MNQILSRIAELGERDGIEVVGRLASSKEDTGGAPSAVDDLDSGPITVPWKHCRPFHLWRCYRRGCLHSRQLSCRCEHNLSKKHPSTWKVLDKSTDLRHAMFIGPGTTP